MALTIFQTATGEVIYRAQIPRMHAAQKALKKAVQMGASTLLAIESDGRKTDYSAILTTKIKALQHEATN